ncbi:hypothetical protein [Tritonibacter mobilis]|uniref:hypothetical protein n=1 Tax=Tritonibacter mobilis TaxID=379347 RepID=UPI0039A60877
MTWKMLKPAEKLCDRLWPTSEQKLPHEIIKLHDDSAAVVIDIDGVDYILTMQEVPRQRPRPASN